MQIYTAPRDTSSRSSDAAETQNLDKTQRWQSSGEARSLCRRWPSARRHNAVEATLVMSANKRRVYLPSAGPPWKCPPGTPVRVKVTCAQSAIAALPVTELSVWNRRLGEQSSHMTEWGVQW